MYRILLAAVLTTTVSTAHAASGDVHCTLIVDAASGRTLVENGSCGQRFSPASTFKVPLALIGYDAGILVDEKRPVWKYRPEYNATKREQITVDPTIWEKESIIWYSREIVRRVGGEAFARYVADFCYENADVTGTPGRNDGMTRSWVDSSLKISPVEQVAFLRRLLDRELPVSAQAVDMTQAILPTFATGSWTVAGKTGSTRTGGNGRAIGWFVGWAEKEGRRVVFARLAVDARKEGPKGPATRAAFLADLPSLAD